MANETRPDQTSYRQSEPREEFISFTEILGMILRHRRVIAVFVALVTIISAVFFMLSPRQYKAEGFLQVIPPITAIDEKVDQAAFETIIISHLQTIQSAFMAKVVADSLNTKAGGAAGAQITPADLQKLIKISRPPKSYLITVTGTFPSPDEATFIVQVWIEQYLASMRKNNLNVALCQIRSLLKKAQAGLTENQAKVNQLNTRAEQIKPLVDLARGIDDTQIWREVAEDAPAEKMKNLSKIHINGQEQSMDYLSLKKALYDVDQNLAASKANHDFLQNVEKYMEHKISQLDNHPAGAPDFPSNAVDFAETMLKTTDVIEVGKPALQSSSRGVLRKTAIAFFISLVAASFCAYLFEWFKTVKV